MKNIKEYRPTNSEREALIRIEKEIETIVLKKLSDLS